MLNAENRRKGVYTGIIALLRNSLTLFSALKTLTLPRKKAIFKFNLLL